MRMIGAVALAGALIQAAGAQSGQSTSSDPGSPQRTIHENRVTTSRSGTGANEQNGQQNTPSGQAIESILSSTEDLNSIRDGYLRKLSGDGCSPDVAARVAELRAQLGEKAESGSRGQPATTQRSAADLESSMLALAADWYNRRPAESSSIASANPATRDAERGKLLESVLSPRDSQPAGAALDKAQLKAELDRLLAACKPAQR